MQLTLSATDEHKQVFKMISSSLIPAGTRTIIIGRKKDVNSLFLIGKGDGCMEIIVHLKYNAVDGDMVTQTFWPEHDNLAPNTQQFF